MRMKRITTLGFLLMMGASMSALAGLFGFGGTSWKEEVLLHDGSKIIVERSVKRGGRHEIGQEPPIKEQSLAFIIPATNESVTWEDKFAEDIGEANFLPMQLEILKDTAYLVVNPMGCLSYNKWGRPNPPYVVFKYQGKTWQLITLQELPAAFKMPNLIFSSPDDEAKKAGQHIVSAQTIRSLYEGYNQLEYKTILREAVSAATIGCSEMIYTNDGWEGLGFFEHQPSYEACLNYCKRKGVSQQNWPCKTLFKGAK